MLAHFNKLLQYNPKIRLKLLRRRFEFITVMEQAEKATDPEDFEIPEVRMDPVDGAGMCC